MGTELQVIQSGGQMALSSAEIRDQVNLIQEVMRAVMKDGIHYGKIPGCGDKPALLKPGAEKILSTFRISVEPIVEDLSGPDEARYRVITKGIHMATGTVVGFGVGEASSMEDKYKWRGAVCDAEFDDTQETRRRLKYRRDGSKTKQIRTEHADIANTVLKMAKKRSQIDLTLTATGASDVFSQDIEDLPEELRGLAAERESRREGRNTEPDQATKDRLAGAAHREPAPTAPASHPPPETKHEQHADMLTVTGTIEAVSMKEGTKKDGTKFNRYGVKVNGDFYGTFSDTIGSRAADLKDTNVPVKIGYTDDGKFKNIVTIEAAPDELPI